MMRRTVLRSILLVSALAAGNAPALAATAREQADFFRAVQMDDPGTVQSLLGKVDPNSVNPVGGEPALVLAVREGSMRVFDVLLGYPGTQVDAPALNGNTALMMAAFKNNKPAAEALIAKGAAVNRPGWTPLHYAAASGDNDIARLLLARGARIDAESPPASGRYTPLMMAAREGHQDTALFLLKQGADPLSKNSEGLTAARIAERADHGSIAAAIDKYVKQGR
jgi:ankyrin repeat protein